MPRKRLDRADQRSHPHRRRHDRTKPIEDLELIACGEIHIAKDRRSTLIIVSRLRETVRRWIVDRDVPTG